MPTHRARTAGAGTRTAGAGARATGVGLAAAVAVAAGTVLALTPAAPAGAAPGGPTYLLLSVLPTGAKPRMATLRCDPPRGSHPKAGQACSAVAAAAGDLNRLKPRSGLMCSMQYQPATAQATGTWRGRQVRYKHTFSNSCVLSVQTGAVFQF